MSHVCRRPKAISQNIVSGRVRSFAERLEFAKRVVKKKWKLNLNPEKCKSFRMTLKKRSIQSTYFIENIPLEHVTVIRDLGVILDEKLTFGPHVDMTVKKANRALGVLFRSFQTLKSHGHFNKGAVLAAYYAHVRAVLEYCSVIWNGMAKTHSERIEKIQHKFLIWLNSRVSSHSSIHSISYPDLLKHFKISSLHSRRTQHDIMLVYSILRGRVNSSYLLSSFSLAVPSRARRHQSLLTVPFARVNTVRDGLFVRIPRAINAFVSKSTSVDLFYDGMFAFKSSVLKYISSL